MKTCRIWLSVTAVLALGFAGCLPEPAPPPKAPAPPPKPQVVENPTPETPAGTVREKAEVGMGEKGHYGTGVLTTPLDIRWRADERMTLNKIEYGMKMYKGEHGYAPKTHKEFMDKIIKDGMIKLPELPEGEQYLYDPQTEQLMIQKPRP